MADPKYLTLSEFKAEAPDTRLAELSQDQPNNFEIVDDIVTKAIVWAEGIFESKISSRSDYVLKKTEVIEGSSDVATIKEFIYDLGMWKLFKRREFIPDAIQNAFDTQMTWISDVVSRKADLPIFDADTGKQVDQQSHQPIIDRHATNQFEDYNYG